MVGKQQIKKAIELCMALYRVTELLAQDEVLRQRLRGSSLRIVENLAYNLSGPTSKSRFFNVEKLEGILRVLIVYLLIAEKQGWVKAENFHVLKREYTSLYKEIERAYKYREQEDSFERADLAKSAPRELREGSFPELRAKGNFNERQKKIVNFLRKHPNGVPARKIATALKQKERTVGRELEVLLISDFVRKKGKTKGVKYVVK